MQRIHWKECLVTCNKSRKNKKNVKDCDTEIKATKLCRMRANKIKTLTNSHTHTQKSI